jgi:thiamine-monophosphate kinase
MSVADPTATVGSLGERGLLRHLRGRIPQGPGVLLGIGDDAAAVTTGAVTLVTTDVMVDGVHFRRDWAPSRLVGRKALSVNLSDIGAMGGGGQYATVSLCLPRDLPLAFVDGLYDGLLERAAEVGVEIVGGNIAASSCLTIDVTLMGSAERILRRQGAQPGDLVVVTGTLGAAAAGLRFLSRGARIDAEGTLVEAAGVAAGAAADLQRCLVAQLDPSPPLSLARALGQQDLVHAAMDLSDGLSGDLAWMCEESQVSAWVDSSSMPVEPSAARLEREGGDNGFSLALHGGEDYQLLLAVPPSAWDALRDVAGVWDVPVTAVGEFAPGPPGVSVRFGEALRRLRPGAHDHFAAPVREERRDPLRGA